jgi:hypothetical protein
MQGIRPKIVDEIAAEFSNPPKGDVFSVVRQVRGDRKEFSRCFHRFGLSGLESEVEERKSPADRRIENRCDSLVGLK